MRKKTDMVLRRLFPSAWFAFLFVFQGPVAWAVPVEGHKLMISGPNALAVEVGQQVAAQGGNVVDAAVAVGLALSVTSPHYASLGGGGFALVKMTNAVEALDFREVAPAATHPDYYLKRDKSASITGPHAVGVPGMPAGLWALHRKYGHLKWSQLFPRPLALARAGFLVSGEWSREVTKTRDRFNAPGIKTFLLGHEKALEPGERFRQPGLAQALTLLRDKNFKGFYEGPVAQDIVNTVRAAGGPLALEDMKNYRVRWLTPLKTEFEGHTIYLMPPPSSGGVLVVGGLKLIDLLHVKDKAPRSSDEYHLLGEILARVFRGRTLLADPDFHKNPVERLTAKEYLEDLAKSVSLEKSIKVSPLKTVQDLESPQTTHYSVMDGEGHGIAVTVTLNGDFGSGVVSSRYGIALNNEMDDFTTHPDEPNYYGLVQGAANTVEAGKRPLSSMTPTLVEKDGRVVAAVGSPGGPRIISGVLQVLYRLLARQMDADLAIQTPRVHHQFTPDILYVDKDRFSPDVVSALKLRGHQIEEIPMGRVYVVRQRSDGILEGAFDSRAEGAAAGQ